MKSIHFIICIICVLFCFVLFANADTTQSRDGDGQKIQGPAFGSIRYADIGTKGFKCFSTASKMSWEVKITSAASTDASSLGFKYFLNGDESVTYPVSDKFFQWQNAPVSKSPTISKVCLRPYSSATLKRASGIFQ